MRILGNSAKRQKGGLWSEKNWIESTYTRELVKLGRKFAYKIKNNNLGRKFAYKKI